jgi:hypothetical protein
MVDEFNTNSALLLVFIFSLLCEVIIHIFRLQKMIERMADIDELLKPMKVLILCGARRVVKTALANYQNMGFFETLKNKTATLQPLLDNMK